MTEKPWIQVAAALIESGGKYLISKRKAGVHLEGLWEFPGGKCEKGESFENCLKRELIEELGVSISSPEYFFTQNFEYPEKIVELKFFFCSIQSGEPQALGCAGICWVDAEELGTFEFPPADRPVVEWLMKKEKS